MTRPIKFRAWDKDGSKMYFDVQNAYDYQDDIPATTFGYMLEDKNWIVQQFTGLTDKNGKEIYEGDILKRFTEVNESFGFDLVKVQWNNDRCYWELERANDQASYWGHINGSHAREGRYEVIGNIWENPELLK